MLRTTEMGAAVGHRVSPRLVLLAVLSVLAVLAALAPASAMAGGGGGTSENCEATVTVGQDPGVAAIDVECADREISSVEVDTTEDGNLEGNEGTECEGQDRSFTCTPTGSDGSLVSARFDSVSGDVCADPRLTVDFEVSFVGEDEPETINNVEVSGCSDSGGGGSGGDEDDGDTPEGGVDSGAGGTAKSAAIGPALPLVGAALLVLALASVGVFMRRTRTTP
jgi:hypothetical protein